MSCGVYQNMNWQCKKTTDNIPQCKTEGPGPFSTQVKMCQTLVCMDKRIKEDDGEF